MNLTWLDYARRVEDRKIARIVEILNQTNEIISDMVIVPGNTQTGDKTTIRTGLPTLAWRQINKGSQSSKSTTRQIEFTAGRLEGLGKVDEMLVDLADDKAGLRLSENAPYLEKIAQDLASTIIYGNVEVNPERFTGLAAYYSALTAYDSSENVISAGGTGSKNTSIFLVVWGENTIRGFYPRGTKAGIDHQDLGKRLTSDGAGGEYLAYVDQYKTDLGLSVRDWRYGGRICNIDTDDLLTAGDESDTSANLLKYMIKLKNKMPSLRVGRAAWYCNQTVKDALDIKALEKTNAQLTITQLENQEPVTRFFGIPVRRVDAILDTEEAVA